jgi:hypothetical protein
MIHVVIITQYTYLFLIMHIRVYVARMQAKFYKSFPHHI